MTVSFLERKQKLIISPKRFLVLMFEVSSSVASDVFMIMRKAACYGAMCHLFLSLSMR